MEDRSSSPVREVPVREVPVREVPVREVLVSLGAAVGGLQDADLEVLAAEELLAVVRDLEVLRRRFDHATDRLAGELDRSGAHRVDGHRTARAALKHLGRLSGAEAHGRVQSARMLHRLPAVAAAYRRGEVPTGSCRAIARTAANPRVAEFLDHADAVFAAMAATDSYDDFIRWLADWEALAAYETAEFEADRQDAVAHHGETATIDQFPRTPAQRRADALFELFRRAAATPADAQSPEPLVNIVIDQQTFDDEVRRISSDPTIGTDPGRTNERICRTLAGEPLHPSDAVIAAVLGTIRRVVVDAGSTVIDLGRRRRCFTGASRDAALLQAALRARGGAGCLWSGCDTPPPRLQIDHHDPWHHHAPTSPTATPSAATTTASKNTATDPPAAPTAPTASSDPTAHPSPPQPDHRPDEHSARSQDRFR
jgi:hypothetical protein